MSNQLWNQTKTTDAMTIKDLKNKSVDAKELALIEIVSQLSVEEYKKEYLADMNKRVNDAFKGLDIPKFCHNDAWVMTHLKDFVNQLTTCISNMRDSISA